MAGMCIFLYVFYKSCYKAGSRQCVHGTSGSHPHSLIACQHTSPSYRPSPCRGRAAQCLIKAIQSPIGPYVLPRGRRRRPIIWPLGPLLSKMGHQRGDFGKLHRTELKGNCHNTVWLSQFLQCNVCLAPATWVKEEEKGKKLLSFIATTIPDKIRDYSDSSLILAQNPSSLVKYIVIDATHRASQLCQSPRKAPHGK